jgi:hypothetical protein
MWSYKSERYVLGVLAALGLRTNIVRATMPVVYVGAIAATMSAAWQ